MYLIAAGTSSKNRFKTLEKSWSINDIGKYLSDDIHDKIMYYFPNGLGIYAWGINRPNEISKVLPGEYVIDIKNKDVVQIFEFCFFFETNNQRLQNYFGWDHEKNKEEKRQYKYVYFLKNPQKTSRKKKSFFGNAFQLSQNPQWLIRQRYFNDELVVAAMNNSNSKNINQFLGININHIHEEKSVYQQTKNINTIKLKSDTDFDRSANSIRPSWLEQVIQQVEALKSDPEHLERDHEDIVANFFEALGHRRIIDIKYRRGNIDIRIDRNGIPFITIEVKSDWSMTCDSKKVINQAFSYANEIGSRYVIITNGDLYCLFDRNKGLKYDDQLLASFELSNLKNSDLQYFDILKKDDAC